MAIEQHIEELRAELEACVCTLEKTQIEAELKQARARLSNLPLAG